MLSAPTSPVEVTESQDSRHFSSEPLFHKVVLRSLLREEATSEAWIHGKGQRITNVKARVALGRAIDRWKRELLVDDEMIEIYQAQIDDASEQQPQS